MEGAGRGGVKWQKWPQKQQTNKQTNNQERQNCKVFPPDQSDGVAKQRLVGSDFLIRSD